MRFFALKDFVPTRIETIRRLYGKRVTSLFNFISEMPLESSKKFSAENGIYIHVVGSGAPGAPLSVYVHAENSRYLFNCGEGTQRLCAEYKIRMAREPHIFITYPSWKNISGLVGYCLSAQFAHRKKLFIHGDNYVKNVVLTTKKFAAFRRLWILNEVCRRGEEFSDGNITIKYVHLYSSEADNLNKSFSEPTVSDFEHKTGDQEKKAENTEFYSEDDEEESYYDYLPRKRKEKQTIYINKKRRSQSEECKKNFPPQQTAAISYICQTKPVLGKLIIDKCIELGIEIGPLLGKLKHGEDVKLEDGRIIKSSDVRLPNTPGLIIIVVECPKETFLESLLTESAFFKHQSGGHPEDVASAVIHFTPAHIVKNPKYEEWMNRFPRETKHLFINEENKFQGSISVYRQQQFLNLLHPDLFPPLPCTTPPFIGESNNQEISEHDIVKIDENTEEVKEEKLYMKSNRTKDQKIYFKCSNINYIKGETQCILNLRPKLLYDFSYPELLQKDVFVNEALSVEGVIEEIEKLKIVFEEMKPKIIADKRTYPKILFLGTGSSQPNKRRNCSGILIHLDEKNIILLDCGEGTYGQIVRFYGIDKTKEILRNMSIIYISHLHADHQFGLITLLKHRKLAFDELKKLNSKDSSSKNTTYKNTDYKVLNLLAPTQLDTFLRLFNSELENMSKLYNFVPNFDLADEKLINNHLALFHKVNLKEIKTTLVEHCRRAYGIAIVHKNGWKLTYSGDTRPCENLVKLGMHSDILIHEATMDDSFKLDAIDKMHSTTSEAIEIGKRMKAKFTLLTHFSQRYAHIPLFNSNFTENVGIAFDNLLVSINQLPLLPKLNDALKILYSEYYDMLEEIHEKKRAGLYTPYPVSSMEDYDN